MFADAVHGIGLANRDARTRTMQDRPALERSPLTHPLLFARAQPCQALARACGGERSLPATLPTLRT
ncbi:MAG: hypothetical protein COC14_11915 [Burkholderiaceae bacterium]|uniref:Uncharacterized protein n=1 Tax=Cupriavidus metallidurans TaxID=119219 RepID=A0A482IZ85_9BURK|nr:MAG: hypothetical protein COC14_11915 [Burkholderiaceae bacterium]QBP13731.1 hypothetical protein DDF84_029560 [Cupriavidus metallidurans]